MQMNNIIILKYILFIYLCQNNCLSVCQNPFKTNNYERLNHDKNSDVSYSHTDIKYVCLKSIIMAKYHFLRGPALQA